MFERLRDDGRFIPALLVIAVLVPYAPLLSGAAIPIPDDVFISDMADGEFPARVEAGRLLASGQAPIWTSRIFTGAPLIVDPLSLILFAALPPALALGWLIAILLSVAALGTYSLCRLHGGTRSGSFLAGFAFAWSGFFVCQLRHLGVMSTVAYFPLALLCLENAAIGDASDRSGARSITPRHRATWLVGFAAVFGVQLLGGFPQSAYICGLVYASLVGIRSLWLLAPGATTSPTAQRIRPAAAFASIALGATLLGIVVGMASLLPMHELGAISDRSAPRTIEWATQYNYWWPNVLTFFVPYANGNIADGTYVGPSIFWEDYGYVGAGTMLLSVAGAVAGRRRFAELFWFGTAAVAFSLVLGKLLPVYGWAYEFLPGMSRFRMPTRFLFVVELALAMLAGLGLSRVQSWLANHSGIRSAPMIAGAFIFATLAGTTLDLVEQNSLQNPFADTRRWLSAPHSAARIHASGESGRSFTPMSNMLHTQLFSRAHGWSGDLSEYYAFREFLQPNSNLLHGVSTVDGYAGISPSWTVDLIGDHNRPGLLSALHRIEADGIHAPPAFFDWLEALSVRWLLLTFRGAGPRLEHHASTPPAELHRLPGTLPRARLVRRARRVGAIEDVVSLSLRRELDLREEALLHETGADEVVEALATVTASGEWSGSARIVSDESTRVVVHTSAPQPALLVLADTYYPGWVAMVDGRITPIQRANIAMRAVLVPAGAHRVTFRFESPAAWGGAALSIMGGLALAAAALWLHRRAARVTQTDASK